MDSLSVDITPDVSLLPKLGMSGHTLIEALAELVDNSIDARLGGGVDIKITIDPKENRIEVKDNARGMTKEQLSAALTIARESKSEKALGRYGIGLKAACTRLGKEFDIITKSIDTGSITLEARYDEKTWLNNNKWQMNIETVPNRSNLVNGTIIIITNLKVQLYSYLIDKVRQNFEVRYASFIKSEAVNLYINEIKCLPSEPLLESNKTPIDVYLPNAGHVYGWIGLQRIFSNVGDYGFDLFKNNRLIKHFDKSLIPHKEHPSISRVIGVLYLDDVPVNYNKTDFVRDSVAFSEIEKALKNDENVKKVIREATKPKYSGLIGSAAEERIKIYINGFLGTLNKEKLNIPKIDTDSKPIVITNKEITFKGQTYKFRITLASLPIPKIKIIEDKGTYYEICVNQAAPAFKLAKDKSLFVLEQTISGVSYIIGKTQSYSVENLIELEDNLLYKGLEQLSSSRINSRERRLDVKKYTSSSEYLSPNLVDIERTLRQKFNPEDYYFTGTSVLESFLNHLPKYPYYLIYATNKLANEIQAYVLRSVEDSFTVLVNPDFKNSKKELERTNISAKPTIVIKSFEREEAYLNIGNIASFEIALVDLYVEVKRYEFPVIIQDVSQIYTSLSEAKLLNLRKLRRYAKRRGCLDDIEMFLSSDKNA